MRGRCAGGGADKGRSARTGARAVRGGQGQEREKRVRGRCVGGGADKGRSAITGARAVRGRRRGQGQERDNGCAGGARVEARTRAGAR